MHNEYYQLINEMTLNTDIKTILNIKEFVDKNTGYEEEFYKNLYIIVEKEKYLANRYNHRIELLKYLDEKTINKLKEIFINDHIDDKNFSPSIFNKIGYEKVLDPLYQDYFNNHSFTNNQTFDLEEGTIKVCWNNKGWDDILVIFSERENLPITDTNIYRGDKTYKFKKVHDYINDDCKYYYIKTDLGKRYAINRETGKCIRFPSKFYYYFPIYEISSFVHLRSFGRKGPFEISFYDENMKKKKVIKKVHGIDYDYKKELYLIYDTGVINIYNKDLELIKTIDNLYDKYSGQIYSKCSILSVNDGVIALLAYNKIIYYDYLNDIEIDSFNCSDKIDRSAYNSSFIYSEGLYAFFDENGKFGYKNLNKEVIIEPNYNTVGPFLDGIALVDNKKIINRLGNEVEFVDWCNKIFYSKQNKFREVNCYLGYYYLSDPVDRETVKYDLKKGRYGLLYQPSPVVRNDFKGYIVAEDHYVIDDDRAIKDIDFNNKEKGMTKVKK